MESTNRPNRVLMDEARRIFLAEMVPYVTREIETTVGQPIETAAIDVFGKEVGERFIQDIENYEANQMASQRALTQINVTVDFHWPIFKKRLRNRKVMRSALTQIEYASASSDPIEPIDQRGQHIDPSRIKRPDLEPLYVEQRLDDIVNVLGRIGADDSRRRVEEMKKSIIQS